MDFAPLRESLHARDIEKAKSLVTTSNAKARNEGGYGVLTCLCANGPDDPELLRHFVKLGATLELDNDGVRGSPLKFAVCEKKPKLVRALIDLGVPPNICDIFRYTPFARAVFEDDKMCAKILADTGVALIIRKGEEASTRALNTQAWLKDFMKAREGARIASVIMLGMNKTDGVVVRCGNGKDVLRMIGRCIWASRGQDEWLLLCE